jgi:cob(I)alamin adenosyltransferase
MKIYTKTGDKGTTCLYDGTRISKSSLHFELLGEMDELSCRIGLVACMCCDMLTKCSDSKQPIYKNVSDFLRNIQRYIQNFNSYIATEKCDDRKLPYISQEIIEEIEEKIDECEKYNSKLTKFILSGATVLDANVHLCRTQARKTERLLIRFIDEMLDGESERNTIIKKIIAIYLNRMSDYFFVLARFLCREQKKLDEMF